VHNLRPFMRRVCVGKAACAALVSINTLCPPARHHPSLEESGSSVQPSMAASADAQAAVCGLWERQQLAAGHAGQGALSQQQPS
jgi:hypothetical protein